MSQIANKFLAQSPALTLKGNNTGSTGNISDLTVSQVQSMLSIPTSSTPLGLTSGGTGASYASSAALFNGINPMTTTGDLIYESATGVASRLGIGTSGQILTVVSGVPAWSAAGTPTFSGLTQYGAIYAASTTTVASTAAGTAGYILTANSSAAPTFQQINIGTSPAITGTLAAAQFPALTGDVTTTAGSLVTTLATVNSNVGSFGGASSVPSFTVNAKGLITAASATAVIAPAGTLSGTTLNSTVVSSSLTSLGTQSQALNMGSNLINNVTNPVNPQDAATKNYVDNATAGLSWKQPVQAIATSALASNTYSNGTSGVGATLTATANGAIAAIDGYTPVLNDRLLIAGEATASHNGIYSVTQVGTGSTPYILTRTTDANTSLELTSAAVFINLGTANANTAWVQTTDAPTIGTSSINFTKFSAGTAVTYGNGLQVISNVVSVEPLNTTINVASGGVSVNLNAAGAIVNSSGLLVQTDGVTTKINGSNQVEALTAFQENLTLSSGDITNQYKDLSHPVSGTSATVNSVVLSVVGGPIQLKATDYTVSLTGGSGGNTRITFAGGLATGGASALVAGDILMVSYSYLA